MSFLFLFLFGCIDQAPKGSSEIRQELTFRTRNQFLAVSSSINNLANALPSRLSPVQEELYWIASKLRPPNYSYGFGCLTPPDFHYFEQYTLFSHWEQHVVEDDKNDFGFIHDSSKFK